MDPKLVVSCAGKFCNETQIEKLISLVLMSRLGDCGIVTKALAPSNFKHPPILATGLSNQCEAPSLRIRVPSLVPSLSDIIVANGFDSPSSMFQYETIRSARKVGGAGGFVV